MSHIRILNQNDVLEIVSRIRDAGNESGWTKELDFNPEYVSAQVSAMIQSDDYLVIGSDDVGAIMIACVASNWFSPTEQARELIVYVHPSIRKNGHAKKLVDYYIAWAKGRGVARINIGISLGIQPEKVAELYQSLGFEKSGYLFTHSLEN